MIKNSHQIKKEGELPQLSNKHLLKFIAHFRLKGQRPGTSPRLGKRQGCPLSPLLFETLNAKQQQHNLELKNKISLFIKMKPISLKKKKSKNQ